jgi:hypothetical protein
LFTLSLLFVCRIHLNQDIPLLNQLRMLVIPATGYGKMSPPRRFAAMV